MVVQEGPTSIRVSWTPSTPLGNTIGYKIYYSGKISGSIDVSGGGANNHLLASLQNGASYTISIVGTSRHFFSEHVDYPYSLPLSELLHHMSQRAVHHSLQFTPSVPGRPNAVVSTRTAATTISLSWSTPSGTVKNYVVIWERDTSEECSDEDGRNSTVSDGSTSYSIENLEEGSSYTITVTATNAAGSAVSDPVMGVTEEVGEGQVDVHDTD